MRNGRSASLFGIEWQVIIRYGPDTMVLVAPGGDKGRNKYVGPGVHAEDTKHQAYAEAGHVFPRSALEPGFDSRTALPEEGPSAGDVSL